MANPFVAYLNSLHNEQASNQNAIAEMQIRSEYFATMQVKRSLIGFLCDKLRQGIFVVLTGHAGDGKTTLLAQVLAELDVPQNELKEQDEVECGFSLRYIKDFSELTEAMQDIALSDCFHWQGPSLLIANTGPLLNAMKRLLPEDKQLEGILLEAMDQSAGKLLTIEGAGQVYVLNIARTDNTDFIRPFLSNLIADNHWQDCHDCPCCRICPILFNRTLLKEKFDRASTFIENAFIWLQEYDHRATIRQITAHLTYAMTGGNSCAKICKTGRPITRYRYLFSNLLWGSNGIKDAPTAAQIRGVRLIRETGFDQKTTSVDYDLFIKCDVHPYFGTTLNDLFDEVTPLIRPIPISSRQRALKRAYLLFGQDPSGMEATIRGQVFSEWFDEYLDGRKNGTKPRIKTRNAVCRALNTLFVGEATAEDNEKVYLTLRRNNEQTSNVQLLRGQISASDVALRYEAIASLTDTEKLYRLYLKIGDMRFQVGLPLLNYFCEIKNGVIMTDIDPMLSNGIDSLKAQLLSEFGTETENDETSILFLKGTSWQKRKLVIGAGRIEHE